VLLLKDTKEEIQSMDFMIKCQLGYPGCTERATEYFTDRVYVGDSNLTFELVDTYVCEYCAKHIGGVTTKMGVSK